MFPVTEGCTLSFFPTASIYDFRTRSELDTYLVASQIRERAIERINNVTGTYAFYLALPMCTTSFAYFASLLVFFYVARFMALEVLVTKSSLNCFCRYEDLRLRIFSKYPHLFPEEVLH